MTAAFPKGHAISVTVINRRQHAQPMWLLVLIVAVVIGAAALLLAPDWVVPHTSDTKLYNAIVALTLLSIACDSSFLRLRFENANTSMAFIPLLGAVVLLPHPWPMVIAGVTAALVDAFVRRKPAIKTLFNTCQYMLAAGLGQLVYIALGGEVSVRTFAVPFGAFAAAAVMYMALNTGLVALAVSLSSGVSARESWARFNSTLVFDLFSSSTAVLLAFLYVRFDLGGLAVLLLPLFFVRHMYQMNQQLEQKNREQLNLMVRAVEARDPYTSGHSVRVSEYARALARELGLSAKEVDNIETAALLHDVGKMYEEFVPLLRKEGRLTPDERMIMQSHPVRGAELVSMSAGLRGTVEKAIKHHHENYDGSGYPDGMAAEEIPVGARIIMIADTLDAMTTDRPYRRALSFDRVVQELLKYSGTQFDPRIVRLTINSATIRRLVDDGSEFGVIRSTPAAPALVVPRERLVAERVS